jgi:hypothetical protein
VKIRILLILGLAVLGATFWTRGESSECLGLPCHAPPCEFFQQMEMKSALQAVYQDRRLRARIKARVRRENPGMSQEQVDHQAALELQREVLRRAAPNGPIDRNLRRCAASDIGTPPGLKTDEGCARGDQDGPLSEEQAHRKYTTCSEFITAAYRHEDVHKRKCEQMASVARGKMGIDAYGDEEVAGYQAELETLQAALQAWFQACSPSVDARTAREVVRKGNAILKSRTRS